MSEKNLQKIQVPTPGLSGKEKPVQIKVLLVLVDGRIHKVKFGKFSRSMREAPLTLTTLAALTGGAKDYEVSYRLIDESVDELPESSDADIVGISVLTGNSHRAYEVAAKFRSEGKLVVLGGVHLSLVPEEEPREYADVLFIGPAEETWPRFLSDYVAGNYKKKYVYTPSETSASDYSLPIPRRELQSSFRYNIANTVTATRGCTHTCGFCSVPASSRGFLKRPIGEVVDDVKSFPSRLFAFNDVSLTDDPQYAKELFKALIPLKKRWGGLATIHAADDPELLDLMYQSGCRYLLIGFESFERAALHEIHKGFNREKKYHEFMAAMKSYGISIQGCFIFGFDHDTRDVFSQTVERVGELGIDIPRYSLLTPYPGTRLFHKLESENRIVSRNWMDYDTMHVVFRPKQMNEAQLYEGFKQAYRETFKMGSILKRSSLLRFSGYINIVGNLTYKSFIHRLENDPIYSAPNHWRSIAEDVYATSA